MLFARTFSNLLLKESLGLDSFAGHALRPQDEGNR